MGLRKLDTDRITGQVIGGAIDVHRYLGPGLLEHTYEVCLDAALRQRGLRVERQ
jgi:GxxExxY protein